MMRRPGWWPELTPRRVLVALIVGLAVVGLGLAWGRLDVAALHARAAELPGWAVFVGVTVLPLLGFPVSVAHVVAGVRFGLPLGFALVAVSVVIQLLASYGLVKLAPGFFERRLARLRERVPAGAHRPVTLFTLLLPGPPYWAKNYVLPLVGVPLGIYLAWGLPLHIARSLVGLIFGDMSDELTPARLAGFGAYTVVLALGCAWAFRRMRAEFARAAPERRPEHGDRAGRGTRETATKDAAR